MKKGIIYYTDNRLDAEISQLVQDQLNSIGLPIVSTSLVPMNFGKNIVVPGERGILTMFRQILTALEASDADIIFHCEHDVAYHPSHFDFTPKENGVFYYNINLWKIRWEDGHSLWVDNCIQVNGLCGFREDLIKHYRERVQIAEAGPWDRNWGYEPGTPGKTIFKIPFTQETWMSAFPNLDIRHTGNLSKNRWSPHLFRDKRNCQGWKEKDVSSIEGWKNYRSI